MGAKTPMTAIYLNLILFFCVVSVSCCGTPCAPSPPAPPSLAAGKCPRDTLKLGVCASWLGLVTEVIRTKPSSECCGLINGIADIEVAMCLCTALKANVLGFVKMKMSIAISLLLNGCGKKIPNGFKC